MVSKRPVSQTTGNLYFRGSNADFGSEICWDLNTYLGKKLTPTLYHI
jgi:hypothetical protein